MKDILTIFQAYTGSGFLTILYLMAFMYLCIAEKNPVIRAILVYGAGALQVLFFVPLFYYGYQMLDGGTYYRVLWMLPMSVTIAYSGIKILERYPAGAVVIGAAAIIFCGQNVYSNPYITPAENWYHIPQEAIEVCEIIMPEENEERITAVMPDDLLHFIRQYSSRIQMPYGRDYLAPDWKFGNHPLREMMNQEEISFAELAEASAEYGCQYLVILKEKKGTDSWEEAGLIPVGETVHYDIYRNERVDIIKKEYK